MSEARIREALGGMPMLLARSAPAERAHLVDVLCRCYLDNPLPLPFLDGVLLHLLQATVRRYPLFFHASRLLHQSATPEGVLAWTDLSGWQEMAALLDRWKARDGAHVDGALLSDPTDTTTHLVAGSVCAGLLNPALAIVVTQHLRRALSAELVVGLHRLRELHSALHLYFCASDVPLQDDPVIGPWQASLEPLLGERARAKVSYVIPTTKLAETPDGGAMTEELAVTLLESSPVGVVRLDEDGRIVYENPAVRRIVGVRSDRRTPAVGMRIADMPNLQGTSLVDPLRALVADGTPMPRTRAHVTSLIGARLTLTMEGQAVIDAAGRRRGSVVIITDLGREETLQKQLIQAQKMEVLGTLVGGIAHDLNNLLVGVRGNASVVRSRMSPTHPDHAAIERLDNATERLAVVVDGLLGLARRADEFENQTVDCAQVLSSAGDLMAGLLPSTIALDIDVRPALWCAVGRVHLEQVFVNLCINARDAIGVQGRIQVRGHRLEDPPRIAIEVTDDGAGMPDEVAARVFEPMYTTKQDGTGLGLPVSRAILEAYGGTITCATSLGIGSTFTLVLPEGEPGVTDVAQPAAMEPDADAAGLPRVLVVDDNMVVRMLCVEVLESQGYDAVGAQSATEALELNDDTVRAALIDIGLPDMDGIDLASQLTGPVVLMSGTVPRDLQQRAEALSLRYWFVKKPFQIPELLAAVEAACS